MNIKICIQRTHLNSTFVHDKINKIYISKSTKIKNDDEIAFFPPVTGG